VAKNLRQPYAPLLERNAADIFFAVRAAAAPPQQASLERLRGTWASVFPTVRPRRARGAAAPPASAFRIFAHSGRSSALSRERTLFVLRLTPSAPLFSRRRALPSSDAVRRRRRRRLRRRSGRRGFLPAPLSAERRPWAGRSSRGGPARRRRRPSKRRTMAA